MFSVRGSTLWADHGRPQVVEMCFEKYHRVVFDLHGMTMTDMFELLRGHELLDGMCCASKGVEPMQEDLFQKFFQDLCGTQW